MSRQRAIVLLSGGLDSATCVALMIERNITPIALTFNYGQRHVAELDAARKVAAHYALEVHKIVDINLRAFGGSALTADIPVPKNRDAETAGIPITYVPARNTIFLSNALAMAEVLKLDDIYIGVNALDYSGYPDCRPEFVEAFEKMANLATRSCVQDGRRIQILAPLIKLTKSQIIQEAIRLNVPLELTTSCYDPAADGCPCRHCDACKLREKGFAEAGLTDPILRVSK